MSTNPSGKVAYTKTSNNLSTDASEFSEYVSRTRSVSDVSTEGGVQAGAYKADGTINTKYIPNW